MKPRPRLSDVARLAGVSTATVSAVVNNSVDGNIRIGQETRERVWKAVTELGYVANPAARSLAHGKNKILGIFTYEPIFPFQTHNFYYPFLLGIEEEAEAQGYNLLLYTNVTASNGVRSVFHNDVNQLAMVDGAIMMGLDENKDELRRLQVAGYPFVYVGRRDIPETAISFTAADYTSATARLVEMMFEKGHRQVVYICLPRFIESNQDREDGLYLAYQRSGYLRPDNPVYRVEKEQVTPAFVKSLIEAGITGAAVENDILAQAFMDAVHQLGLEIPLHFSVTLCGDPQRYDWENYPDWTMFTIPRREMGSYAVRLLVDFLRHPEEITPQGVYLPCKIIPGQTIAAPFSHLPEQGGRIH